MSRTLRWPTLQEAIVAQYYKMREELLKNDMRHRFNDTELLQMAQDFARLLVVAACDPYEVLPNPGPIRAFYNPATNYFYRGYYKGAVGKCWVWNNMEFSFKDNPILEFHHDVYLNTIGSP